jgi:hypothetical protein
VAQRRGAAVLTIPLAALPRAGFVMAVELAVAGIGLEVVPAEEVPGVLDANPHRHPAARDLGGEGILLAVRVSSDDVGLALVDGNGGRLAGASAGRLRVWTIEQLGSASAVGETSRREGWALEVGLPIVHPTWSPDPLAALRDVVAELLPRRAPDLLARFDPAIRLVTTTVASDDDLPLGASRLNGRPDVPAGFAWPRWPGPTNPADGPPGPGALSFLAQINLAELPRLPNRLLPPDGWLLFFADLHRSAFLEPEDCAAQRVVYVPADAAITRHEPPGGDAGPGLTDGCYPEHIGCGPPAAVRFEVVTSAPFASLIGALAELDEPARTQLHDLVHAGKARQAWHQLVGEPNPIQGDPILSALATANPRSRPGATEEECAAAIREESARWRSLLQLDLGWDGRIWFLVRSDHLAARTFDHTLVEYQR